MRVRSGWSSEYAKKKFDVEMDENDLTRMLLDNGISQEYHDKISVAERFRVLYCEVEIISRATLFVYDNSKAELLKGEIERLREQRDAVYTKAKKRLGIVLPEAGS